jgi:hypothetical protein
MACSRSGGLLISASAELLHRSIYQVEVSALKVSQA